MRSIAAACASAARAPRAQSARGGADEPLARVAPDARLAEEVGACGRRRARCTRVDRAHVLGDHPQHARRRLALAGEAVEHAREARAVAREHRLGAAATPRSARRRAPRRAPARTRARRPDRAARASGSPGARRAGCPRRGRRGTRGSPPARCFWRARRSAIHAGSVARSTGIDVDHHAGAVQRAEPGRFCPARSSRGQRDEGERCPAAGAAHRRRSPRRPRCRACRRGCAARCSLRREERERRPRSPRARLQSKPRSARWTRARCSPLRARLRGSRPPPPARAAARRRGRRRASRARGRGGRRAVGALTCGMAATLLGLRRSAASPAASRRRICCTMSARMSA